MNLIKSSAKIHRYIYNRLGFVRSVRRWRQLQLFYQIYWNEGTFEFGDHIYLNHPVLFQGKGTLILEDKVTLGFSKGGSPTLPIMIQPRKVESIIKIGIGTTIVNGTEIIARSRISIGKNCLIGPRCMIIDSDFHNINPDKRNEGGLVSPIEIEDNVWLGFNVTILKGIKIGSDSVIGAGCVVSKNVPSGSIAVGNPMKIIDSVYK